MTSTASRNLWVTLAQSGLQDVCAEMEGACRSVGPNLTRQSLK